MGRRHIVALSMLLVGGCSSSSAPPAPITFDAGDAGVDAEPAVDADADAATPRPVAPQEVNLGGKVMTAPRIVPITYDGDAMRANIEAFIPKLGASTFWRDVTLEYGVGPAVAGRPVHLSGPAPMKIDDASVKTWILSMVDGTHPEFDPPDGDTMYAIYYPEGTTYTLDGWTGCKEFGASDNLAQTLDGRAVPYIVLPRCPAVQGLDVWNTLSAFSSHEFYEEATDPSKTAWFTVDAAHMPWSLTPPFSEIGDMCIADLEPYITPPDIGSAVQRAWSNAAAAAGHNPCVPVPRQAPYFVAAPDLPDDVAIGFAKNGWSGKTKGIVVPLGQSRTVDVKLWSEGAVPAWRVRAYDLAAATGNPAELTLTLDRDRGASGDTLKLTITALKAGADGGSRFLIYSDDGVNNGFWFGYVMN